MVPIVILYRVLDTQEPDHRHGQVGGVEDVDQHLVEEHPERAVCRSREEVEGWFIQSNKIVSETSEEVKNTTKSLDTNDLVNNSVPLPQLVPHEEKVDVHWDVEQGLHSQDGEQCVLTNPVGQAGFVVRGKYFCSIVHLLII